MRVKKFIAAMMIVVAAVGMIGCSKKQRETQEQNATYSNLVDVESQKGIEKELLEAGVSEESVRIFLEWVQAYNANVKSASAFGEGYQEMVTPTVDYNDVYLKEEYKEDGSMIMDMNCRLTAFLLYREFLTVTSQTDEYDPYLMFDMEEMENEEHFKEIRKEKDKFIGFFNPVDVEENTNIENHIQAIQDAWRDRGVQLAENEKMALITMYLHDQYENKRFVGHTGVALYQENGVVFVEKYGFNQPFQITRFADEEAMVQYLLSRPDLVGDGTEEPVIVMKNSTVISE